MPFGLWNALKTFKRCLINVFSKFLERDGSFHRKDIISIRRIEVGQVNLELIVKLPNSSSMSWNVSF